MCSLIQSSGLDQFLIEFIKEFYKPVLSILFKSNFSPNSGSSTSYNSMTKIGEMQVSDRFFESSSSQSCFKFPSQML